MRLFFLGLLALSGCHQVCGSSAPFWVVADCVDDDFLIPEDTGLVECDVLITITANGQSTTTVQAGDAFELVATIENVSGAPLEFVVADPCPNGLVTFEGLDEGYDYYGSCQAGDCAQSGDPTTHALDDGEALTESVTLETAGDACNNAIAPGRYAIGGTLPLYDDTQPTVCTVVAQLTIP